MVREMRLRVPLLFPHDMLNNGRSVVEQLEPNDDYFGTERLSDNSREIMNEVFCKRLY